MSDRVSKKALFSAATEKGRVSDNFYVSFLKLPENTSNILAKQLKSLSRPDVSFEPDSIQHRGYSYSEKGYVRFSPITLEFFDDENAVISTLLYVQIYRQLNKYSDLMGNVPEYMNPADRDYRFDIKVQLFNSKSEITEEYILTRCFITRISHQPYEVTQEDSAIITVELQFDNIAYKVMDDFVEMRTDTRDATLRAIK
jgi:hypothetical protein